MVCCKCNRSGTFLELKQLKVTQKTASNSNDFAANLDCQDTDVIQPVPVSDQPVSEPTVPAPVAIFSLGELDGDAFCKGIDDCCKEVVNWKQNIVRIPTGGAGRAFVDELARLFQSYADNNAIEPIALKACMVMQVLLLQKHRRQSKAKEHSVAHNRRLALWQSDQISSLIEEGCSDQDYHHLRILPWKTT